MTKLDLKRVKGGQAVLMAVLFFLAVSIAVVGGIAAPVLADVKRGHDALVSRQALFAAESLSDDLSYRAKNGRQYGAYETLSVGSSLASATVADTSDGNKEIISSSSPQSLVRQTRVLLTVGEGAAFHFGVEAGQGGFTMENSSRVTGNVYANGPVSGSGSSLITGDVVSSGAAGVIDGVHAGGNAYAHTITDSIVDKDAFYTSISGTTVAGTSRPGSADQPQTSMPISDAKILEWEADAEAGGTYAGACPYQISSSVTIGPLKIPCDLRVTGGTVTFAGPIWVKGDVTFSNSPLIKISSAVGNRSIAIIAHDPAATSTKGLFDLGNTVEYQGSGGSNSYLMLVSMNSSAETGSALPAITLRNSATVPLLAYAPHGEVALQNSVNLNEVTAWRIRLRNSVNVTYKTGLGSLLFSSGPSGGYSQLLWREVE